MRARSRAILGRTLAGGGLALVFTSALVAGVVLHTNLPGFRRAGTEITNRALAPVFEGKLTVGSIDRLEVGPKSRAVVHTVEVVDPQGRHVLRADGIDATINLRSLLRSLWVGEGPAIELEKVHVVSADVVLDRDAEGTPTIARAFHPRPSISPKPDEPKKTATTSRSDPYLDIASARIDHAKIHGNLVPPALDGESHAVVTRIHLEHDVVRVDLDDGQATLHSPHAPNQKEPVQGGVKGALTYDIVQAKLALRADLVGHVGAVPIVAHAQLDGDVVDATVDVARVEVEPLGKSFSSLPFGRPVEAHAHAHGTLPLVELDLRGRVGESDLTGKGHIDLREGHAFALDLEAQHVDASAYGLPLATDITTTVKASGQVAGQGRLGVTGKYTVETKDGTVSTERVPALVVNGEIEEETLTAAFATKTEPGVELAGNAEMDLGTFVTRFDAVASSPNLRAITRVPVKVDGSASVAVRGNVNLLAETIDARATLRGDHLAYDAFAASHLEASGLLQGPLRAPVLDVGFTGHDLEVKAKDKKPLVYPTASGRARIAFVPTLSILSAAIDVGEKGGPTAIGASATHINVLNGVVEARGVQVTGLGEPLDLDLQIGPGAWSIRAKSDGVDLRRAADATGLRELRVLPEGTKASVDVDLRNADGGATGHADIVVTSEPGKLLAGGVRLETHARAERGHVVANAKLSSEGLGVVEIVNAELDVPGRLDARSLERTTGVIDLRGQIDLAQGGALLGGDKIEQMSGIAYLQGRIERGDPTALPAVRATVRTAGLDVTYSADPSEPSAHVGGIDLAAHASWDGRTEDTELAVLSWDKAGLLANAIAKAKIPIVAWATGDTPLTSHSVADIDLNASADLPLRSVADLPGFLGLPELRGKFGAHVGFEGEVAHPSLTISAKADGVRAVNRNRGFGNAPGGATHLEPLDGVLEARWDGERGVVSFALDERKPDRPPPGGPGGPRGSGRTGGSGPAGRPPPTAFGLPDEMGAPVLRREKRAPGHVHGLITLTDARMLDLLRGRSPLELPWSASSEIEIQDLNLGALPIPATTITRQLTGALSGRFRIRDLNRAASFEAKATVADFGMGGAQVESLSVLAGGRDKSLFVNAQIKDADSQATLQFSSQSPSVKSLDFGWDVARPSRLDYAVQNAQIGLFLPIVRRHVSEMDGRINGAGSVTIDGDKQVFEGGLALTQTSLYVNALGEQISGLTAVARFDRSGTFTIDDATGKLGDGEFHAAASGRMKGFQFYAANATFIATKDGVPISSEGASFASAAGRVDVEARMIAETSTLEVKLKVPNAQISLPDRSTQVLQPIEADPTIDIGIRKKDGKLDTTAVRRNRGGTGRTQTATTNATFTTKLEAELGQKVRLEGRGLDISLGGKTYVQLANELSVTGQIDLRGGTIEVHGRRFTVDRGVVTFPEGSDPTNPSIVAAAYWDAPDRSRVWVEFAGPLKTGTLTLRSEPSYSKNEILSILLFGQPDPNMAAAASTSKSGDAGATAIGTGFVAGDVNRMLGEIDTNLNYETDTLSGNRARTKFGRSFFDQRLKLQIGYAPGATTYREPDTTYLLLNWQFIPKWSLLGTAGNRGTSILDVLWQHRY